MKINSILRIVEPFYYGGQRLIPLIVLLYFNTTLYKFCRSVQIVGLSRTYLPNNSTISVQVFALELRELHIGLPSSNPPLTASKGYCHDTTTTANVKLRRGHSGRERSRLLAREWTDGEANFILCHEILRWPNRPTSHPIITTTTPCAPFQRCFLSWKEKHSGRDPGLSAGINRLCICM